MIRLELETADYRATCLECDTYWTADSELALGDLEAVLQDHEVTCRG